MTPRPEPHAPAHVSAALDRLGLQLDEDYPVSKPAPARPTPTQAEIEALVARFETIADSRFATRDQMILNCQLGQITLGDISDAAAALRELRQTVRDQEALIEGMEYERNYE